MIRYSTTAAVLAKANTVKNSPNFVANCYSYTGTQQNQEDKTIVNQLQPDNINRLVQVYVFRLFFAGAIRGGGTA